MADKMFIACNVLPLHHSDVGGLEKEKRREAEEYTNRVDPSRTKDNVWFIGEHNSKSCQELISEFYENNDLKIKKNTRCAMSMCYRISNDFKGDKQEVWKSCLDFAINKKGFNVLMAVVHKDEDGEHLETIAIPTTKQKVVDHREPILDDDGNKIYYKKTKKDSQPRYKTKPIYKKDNNGNVIYKNTVNYKNIFGTKAKMASFQTELAEEVGKPFGLRRGKQRFANGEKKKSLNDLEYQEKKLNERVKQQEANYKNNNQTIANQLKQIEANQIKLDEQKEKVKDLELWENELDKQEEELNTRETSIFLQEDALNDKKKDLETAINEVEEMRTSLKEKLLNFEPLQSVFNFMRRFKTNGKPLDEAYKEQQQQEADELPSEDKLTKIKKMASEICEQHAELNGWNEQSQSDGLDF